MKFFSKCTTVCIVSCLLAGCSSDSIKLKKESFLVELGDPISTDAKTYVNAENDQSILKETTITFKKSDLYTVDKQKKILRSVKCLYLPVGSYDAKVRHGKLEKNLVVEVKDTKAPKFVDFKDEISVELGADVKFEDYFKAEDLSQVTISINKDKLDLTKEGSYEIQVTATDQYKNIVTKKATVSVTAKEVVEEPANNSTTNNAPGNNDRDPSNGSNPNTGGNNTQAPSQPQQPIEPACQAGVPLDEEEANIITSNGIWGSFEECIKYMDDNGLTGTAISVVDKCYKTMEYTFILH